MALPVLPSQQVLFEERSFTADILERCHHMLSRCDAGRDGYLLLRDGDEAFYALLRGGAIVRAGQFTGGRAYDLTVSVFEHILGRSESGSFTLCAVEPMLFDALDLLLSRQAAVIGTARFLPLGDLARTLRREGRDVVLTFGVPGEINVAIFRRGAPFRVFLANNLAPVRPGTILERIDGYVAKAEASRGGADVTIAIYDLTAETHPLLLAPVADPPADDAPPPAASQASIAVTFRGRTVARVPVVKQVTTIGRVKECDILVDNLGVSRVHCAVVRTADGLFLEDRGSLNGVVVNDEPIRRAPLKDGDVIQVGKHRLIVTMDPIEVAAPVADERTLQAYDATVLLDTRSGSHVEALPLSAPDPDPATRVRMDAADPYALPKGDNLERGAGRGPGRRDGDAPAALARGGDRGRGKALPRLVFDEGTAFEMVAPVVTIGSGDDVDLRLDGFLVNRSMARIVKDGTGRYRIERLSRLHRPRINGSPIKDEEILLDGDEVSIGKARFTFAAS